MRMKTAKDVTAADLMTSPAVTIGPDETVEHAARLMYDRKVKRLPVVDARGRPVGILPSPAGPSLISNRRTDASGGGTHHEVVLP
jgi:CBS-domain-containing membrane protein